MMLYKSLDLTNIVKWSDFYKLKKYLHCQQNWRSLGGHIMFMYTTVLRQFFQKNEQEKEKKVSG